MAVVSDPPNMSSDELDYVKLAKQVEEISLKSDDEIYGLIGASMDEAGLEITASGSLNEYRTSKSSQYSGINDLNKSFSIMANLQSMNNDDKKAKGSNFFNRFKSNLRDAICSDSKIADLINGDGTLKEYLVVGIPLVLAALGLSSLNPVLLVIVAAVFALIVKVGFKSYCETD